MFGSGLGITNSDRIRGSQSGFISKLAWVIGLLVNAMNEASINLRL